MRQCVSSSVRQFVILSAMELGSAGRHYLRPNIVCVRVLSGLVCCSGRRMDLIPRAEHRVGRMRLSMELAHLVRGGNFLTLRPIDVLYESLWSHNACGSDRVKFGRAESPEWLAAPYHIVR